MSFIVLSFHRPEHGLDPHCRSIETLPLDVPPFSSRLTKSVLNIVSELQITINMNNQVLEVLAHMVFFFCRSLSNDLWIWVICVLFLFIYFIVHDTKGLTLEESEGKCYKKVSLLNFIFQYFL